MTLRFSLFLLLLFPVLIAAQDTKTDRHYINADSGKQQWIFENKKKESIITITEGQTLKIKIIAGYDSGRRVLKGLLEEINDTSLVFFNQNKVRLEISKRQIVQIKEWKKNGFSLVLLGLVLSFLGLFLCLMSYVLFVLGGSLSDRRGNPGVFAIFGLGVLALAVLSFKSATPDTITDPFSEEWNYTEVNQSGQQTEKKDIYHP